MAERIRVEITGDSRDLQAAAHGAAGSFKTISRSAGQESAKASGYIDRLKAKFGALGRERARPTVEFDDQAARARLDGLLREIRRLDRERANVKIGADDAEVRARVAKVREELASLERVHAHPKVDVSDAGAQARIERLRTELAELQRRRVQIRVGVDTATADARLRVLRAEADRTARALARGNFRSDFARLGADAERGAAGVRRLGTDTRSADSRLGKLVPKIHGARGALIALAVAAAPALVPMIGSLGAATAGVGALGVAGAGALLPLVALGLGVRNQFKHVAKDQKAVTTAQLALDKARASGSAAAIKSAQQRLAFAQRELRQTGELGRAWAGLKGAAQRAIGGGVTQTIGGLGRAIKALTPTVRSLRPAFTDLGRTVGASFRQIGQAIASPQIRAGLQALVRGSGQVVAAATPGFIALGKVLLNIANAAMPSLVREITSGSAALQRLAGRTSDVGRLTGTVNGLVAQFDSWKRLIGATGRMLLALFRDTAGQGKGLVDSLTRGADQLARWLNSARGVSKVHGFFAALLPVIRQLAGVLGGLVPIALRFAAQLAPALLAISRLARELLGPLGSTARVIGTVVNVVATLVGKVPALRQLVAAFIAMKVASAAMRFTGVSGLLSGLMSLVGGLGRAKGAIAAFRVAAAAEGGTALTGLAAGFTALRGKATSVVPAVEGAGKQLSLFGGAAGEAAVGAEGAGVAAGVGETGIAGLAGAVGLSVPVLGLAAVAAGGLAFGIYKLATRSDGVAAKLKTLHTAITASRVATSQWGAALAANRGHATAMAAANARLVQLAREGKRGTDQWKNAVHAANVEFSKGERHQWAIANAAHRTTRQYDVQAKSVRGLIAHDRDKIASDRAMARNQLTSALGLKRLARDTRDLGIDQDRLTKILNRQAAASINAHRQQNGLDVLYGKTNQNVGQLIRTFHGLPAIKRTLIDVRSTRAEGALASVGLKLNALGKGKYVAHVFAETASPAKKLAQMRGTLKRINDSKTNARVFGQDFTGPTNRKVLGELKRLANTKTRPRITAVDQVTRTAANIGRTLRRVPDVHPRIDAVDRATGVAARAAGSLRRVPTVHPAIMVTTNAGRAAADARSAMGRVHNIARQILITTVHRSIHHGWAQGGPVWPTPAFADGGEHARPTAGGRYARPTFLVGEERRPEWVISTNPAYRQANLGYLAAAADALGVAHAAGIAGASTVGAVSPPGGDPLAQFAGRATAQITTLRTSTVSQIASLVSRGTRDTTMLRTQGVSQLTGLSTRGVAALGATRTGTVGAARAMHTGTVAAARTMHHGTVGAVRTMHRDVAGAARTMRRDVVAAARTMRRDVVAATRQQAKAAHSSGGGGGGVAQARQHITSRLHQDWDSIDYWNALSKNVRLALGAGFARRDVGGEPGLHLRHRDLLWVDKAGHAAHGGLVGRTGLAVVHRDERIIPDPQGPYARRDRTPPAAPQVTVFVDGEPGMLTSKVRAEIDGYAAPVVLRQAGAQARRRRNAPGRR